MKFVLVSYKHVPKAFRWVLSQEYLNNYISLGSEKKDKVQNSSFMIFVYCSLFKIILHA